ncbi:MAG: stage III sporulation protein AB [Clostridia bacterium]|nr:stage III sporulation protein AB [Clostridia bacterium]
MIVFKLAGAGAILIASYMTARNLHSNMKDREKELEEIIFMFEEMKNNSFNNNDISALIEESIQKTNFKTKQIFKKFVLLMHENKYTDCFEAWENAKDMMTPLSKEDTAALDSFFKKSNDSTVSSFIEKTDEVIKRLADNLREIKENADKNKKIYYNSCICIGILTVILLI